MAATYAKRDTAYFVFDIESVADGDLVSRLRYPGESLEPQEAIARYRAELLADSGKDFIPYTYQLPVSLVIAKVGIDYRLTDLVALDEVQSRPAEIVRSFRRYGHTCNFHLDPVARIILDFNIAIQAKQILQTSGR